jgi:hypothetical protein
LANFFIEGHFGEQFAGAALGGGGGAIRLAHAVLDEQQAAYQG